MSHKEAVHTEEILQPETTNRVNRHGVPLSEIVVRPTKKEYANTPRLPLHMYPHIPLYQAPINLWQVRVKDHRIFDIIIAHYNDYTIDDLVRRFDTLSRQEIESVVGFYLDEKSLVDEYIEYGNSANWLKRILVLTTRQRKVHTPFQ